MRPSVALMKPVSSERVAAAQVQVRVAVAGVELERQPGLDPAPEHEAKEDRVACRRAGPPAGDAGQPAPGVLDDVACRWWRRVEVEPVAVGQDRLHADGARAWPRRGHRGGGPNPAAETSADRDLPPRRPPGARRVSARAPARRASSRDRAAAPTRNRCPRRAPPARRVAAGVGGSDALSIVERCPARSPASTCRLQAEQRSAPAPYRHAQLVVHAGRGGGVRHGPSR